MKIYKATYWEADAGQMVSWHATEDRAEIWIVRQKLDHGPSQGPCGIELVNFPTTKASIVEWLNVNLNTDNG